MTSVVSRDICPAHHRGSTHGSSAEGLFRKGSGVTPPVDLDEVRRFLDLLYDEASPAVPRHRRWREIRDEIATRSRRPAPTPTRPRRSSSAPASPGATRRGASGGCTGR